MKLKTFQEVKKLKGKQLCDIRHPEHPLVTVTSVSNTYIRLNNGGIKILTSVFLEYSQQFYEIIEN